MVAQCLNADLRKYFEHFLFGWGIEDIAGGEVFGLRVSGGSDAFGGVGEVVSGVAELNVGAKQEPMGAGLAEGHSDASGIYNSGVANPAVKLHVGVAADDDCGGESFEDWEKAVFGRQASEDVVFVLGRGVTEEDGAEVGDFKCYGFWPGGEPLLMVRIKLLGVPADDGTEGLRHG